MSLKAQVRELQEMVYTLEQERDQARASLAALLADFQPWVEGAKKAAFMGWEEAIKFSRILQKIRTLVEIQAKDEGLWFDARYATEDYLQLELRKLHAVIERAR